MKELFSQKLIIGTCAQSPGGPLIDAAATTVREYDDLEVGRWADAPKGSAAACARIEPLEQRRYGGVTIKLRGGRGLFIGLRNAGMLLPSRWRPGFMIERVRITAARRLATSSVGAELSFPPRTSTPGAYYASPSESGTGAAQ